LEFTVIIRVCMQMHMRLFTIFSTAYVKYEYQF